MLKHIEEFHKYVGIVGFRDAGVKDVDAFLKSLREKKLSNVEVQFFDARFVATWQHLYFAVLNALTAFENKTNTSKSLAMETMLYASAQRQIRKATLLLGIKPTSSEIAALAIGNNRKTVELALQKVSESIKAKRDDAVLELSDEKLGRIKETFGISDVEIETVMRRGELEGTLIDLVIERMALLSTQK